MLSLLAESWTWYSFACVVFIARYISRWLQLGSIKRYQLEDYIMLAVFCFYTILVTCMNIVSHLDTNLMEADDIPLLTPASIESRIRGSKLVLVVEQSMIITVWGCKVCLLLIYRKLTFGLQQQVAVKLVAGYVVLNFIVMETLYLGVWCRPFNQYWAVPVANVQCSTALNHLIINAIFNITSDIMMLCIPLPLLITSKLPRTKKLILCGLFGLGVFVILCAVLNKYYSFTNPFSPMWTYWYIREASTAIFVANIPPCWTLMRWMFNVRSFNSSGGVSEMKSRTGMGGPNTGAPGRRDAFLASNAGARKIQSMTQRASANDIEMGTRMRGESERVEVSWWEKESKLGRFGRGDSEEYIVEPQRAHLPLEIWESKEFNVVDDGMSDFSGKEPDATRMRTETRGEAAAEVGIARGEPRGNGSSRFETRTTVTALKKLEPETP